MNTNSLNSQSLVWTIGESLAESTSTTHDDSNIGLIALPPIVQPTSDSMAPRRIQTLQMQRNLLSMLPVELKLMIAKSVPKASRLELRVTCKEWASNVAHIVKRVHVKSSPERNDALRVFSPGGLNEMTFSGDDIADIDLAQLPERLQIVRLLNCNGISKNGLGYLAALPHLKELHLDNCNNITDACLAALSGMRQLSCLCLFYCELVTDAGLLHLINVPNLKELNLGGCDRITDTGLSYLSPMVQLISLDLTACESVTNDGLAHLANLSQLRILDLTGCELVGDAGLEHLLNLTQLIELNLSRCNVSDAGLEELQRLTNLKFLRLDACEEVTDDGLDHLHALPNLKSVNVTDCEWVTDEAIARLIQRGVHVEYEEPIPVGTNTS